MSTASKSSGGTRPPPPSRPFTSTMSQPNLFSKMSTPMTGSAGRPTSRGVATKIMDSNSNNKQQQQQADLKKKKMSPFLRTASEFQMTGGRSPSGTTGRKAPRCHVTTDESWAIYEKHVQEDDEKRLEWIQGRRQTGNAYAFFADY